MSNPVKKMMEHIRGRNHLILSMKCFSINIKSCKLTEIRIKMCLLILIKSNKKTLHWTMVLKTLRWQIWLISKNGHQNLKNQKIGNFRKEANNKMLIVTKVKLKEKKKSKKEWTKIESKENLEFFKQLQDVWQVLLVKKN